MIKINVYSRPDVIADPIDFPAFLSGHRQGARQHDGQKS
jgi:hypothetical protein